jgi:allantoinase
MKTLREHGRYPYSSITQRPGFAWPQGDGLAVYIGLNLEHFAFAEGLGGELVPSTGLAPDVLNYAWRDYGNRVGAWRMLALFESLDMPVSLLVNASIYDYCPEVVTAYRDSGAEIVAHGHTNSEKQGDLTESEEAAMIAGVSRRLTDAEGMTPKGWLGPWISESAHTPDLLHEGGYTYFLDWCHDDQPVWMRTRGGHILSVPYPQEVNDIPAILVRRTSAETFANMIIDNFDEMLDQSTRQPLVMGIALHSYIVGQPFRLRHLRRALGHIAQHRERIWLTTTGQVAQRAIDCLSVTE